MTIDEAIAKYKKLANNDRTCYPEEAQQLAEWLEELKELREKNETLKALYENVRKEGNNLLKRERNKAIDDVIDKLAEYEDLDEQGRLVKLPCKVGNTVYRYVEEKGCVLEYTVWNISMSAYESGGIDIVIEGCAEAQDEVEDEFSLSLIDFKKEFFNTRAEAEQKLKEMESD